MTLAPASKKQEQFLNSDATITLAGGSAGSGKALRHGEKVLTDQGFRNIEDVKVGDTVITPNNTKETIVGVYPQGLVDIYRVTFHDGSTVDTCGEHLWSYRDNREGVNGKNYVGSTLEIKRKMQDGKRLSVPLCEPVNTGIPVALPLNPYVLGVLIGDGSMTTNSVSFTSTDYEVVQNVIDLGFSVKQWSAGCGKAPQYGIHGVQQKLRDMNLLHCRSESKFIPYEYKIASIEDRFRLLQGLFDTDGYVDANGRVSYATVSPKLKDDVVWILHSLGYTATVSVKTPFYKKDGVRVYCKDCYTIYVRGHNFQKLFSISRKLVRIKERVKKIRNGIKSIEAIGQDYATCIAISGTDKLFITSNFVVTHNTFVSLLIALKFMQHPRATGVIFRRTSKMITSPGSIWHEAVSLYTSVYKTGLRIRHRENEIVFPNGALLKFSHMQHASNMYDHKG